MVVEEGGIDNVECTSKWKTKLGQIVPCGVCMACRITRTEHWAMRIEHEMHGKTGCFLTLTYAEDPITLSKQELQKFFKRLRRKLDVPIKYYACGEYGDRTARPHYHAIIIGWSPLDIPGDIKTHGSNTRSSTFVESIWKFGNNTVGSVTPESIRYVTGYIRKKLYGDKAIEEYGDRIPPFALMSLGLGKDFLLDNADRLSTNLMMTRNGKRVSLPRYYKDQLDKLETYASSRMRWKSKKERFERVQDYFEEGHNLAKFVDDEQSDLSRRRRHLEARSKLNNKGRF